MSIKKQHAKYRLSQKGVIKMNDTMAERLTNLREKIGLSQSEVARRLDVNRTTINAYEQNEIKPSLNKLIALADLYHTSTDYILGRTRQEGRQYIDAQNLTPEQIALLQEFVRTIKQ